MSSQGGHDTALDAARIESFGALQTAIDVDQNLLQRVEMETAQAVAEGVIAEGSIGADPVLQVGVSQVCVQLLKTGEAKGKGVKQSEKDRGRRDVRGVAGIGERSDFRAKVEDFLQVGAEGRQGVGALLHSLRCKTEGTPKRSSWGLPSSSARFGLLALSAEQLTVDVGDFLQALFDVVVVVDPATDPLYLIGSQGVAGCPTGAQRHRQVPDRAVAFAASALTVWISTGNIALQQGAAKSLIQRRQQPHQAFAALLEGQGREFGEVLSFLHIDVRL